MELDFEEITAQKTGFIARSPLLATPIQPLTLGQSTSLPGVGLAYQYSC